jgi:hypothetical protein
MERLQRALILGAFFLLVLSMAWAGTRFDGSGNTIKRDVVSPAGGARIKTFLLGSMNATAGQVVVGQSQDSAGMRLYHGVHGPVALKTSSRDWDEYK